jgi:hypothetical protein
MSNVPDGAQLSDDGQWWWDGANWQPVNPGDGSSPAGDSDSTADITPEELQRVNDNNVEPGDENQLDERLRPYFEPDFDGIADDTSYAEQAETMDDSQYTGGNADSNANANTGADSNEGNSNQADSNQEGN